MLAEAPLHNDTCGNGDVSSHIKTLAWDSCSENKQLIQEAME